MCQQPVAQGAGGEGLAGAGRHLHQRARVGLRASERSSADTASIWQSRRPSVTSGGMARSRRPQSERLPEPTPQRLRAMEGEDTARRRIRVGVVAEQGFGARSDIFEPDLAFLTDEVLGHAGDVARGLLREAGKGRAFRLWPRSRRRASGLRTARSPPDRGRLELAHRDAKPGAEVHFTSGLDQPAACGKPPVDQRPGLVLRMEGGFVHDQLLGEIAPDRKPIGRRRR